MDHPSPRDKNKNPLAVNRLALREFYSHYGNSGVRSFPENICLAFIKE